MEKRIFTYWVNPPEGLPSYIQLCMQTWYEHIPGLEVVIINHDNIQDWVGEPIDLQRFTRISLPQQSDVVFKLMLAKHGGIFMDADTIVIKDIFEEINKIDPEKLVIFGHPNTLKVQTAIMISLRPNNKFITAVADEALKRLNEIPKTGEFNAHWSHFSNAIFELVGQDESIRSHLEVLCRTETGNILESKFFEEKN